MSRRFEMTNRRLALIHVAKAKLELSDEGYRDALSYLANVESSKDLDEDGFDTMMGFFEWKGFQPIGSKAGPKEFGARPGMATDAQIAYIRDLWDKFSDAGESGLNTWLENSFGVTNLRFLDTGGASKALTALKRMTSRPQKAPEKVKA